MEYKEFITSEIKKMDQAIALAKKAKKTTVNLHDFYYHTQNSDDVSQEDAFTRDTLKYFDTNGAFRELESLQMQLGDLKNKLIEIKMANDQMLFAGGFVPVIDETIARVFLKNTLCKLQAKDENTPAILDETIQELEQLKAQMPV